MRRQRLRKFPYYLRSAITLMLALRVRSWLGLLLWRPGGTLELRNGLILEVPELLDLLIIKETICDDAYHLGELAVDTGLIVDVGAGIGEFAVFAASKFMRGSVLACEPDPVAFAVLERNIRRNRLANVEARRVAVGTRDAYTVARSRWSAETMTRPIGTSASSAVGERLDELIADRAVDLVKIDCEGAELDVLESLGGKFSDVKRIVIEYHDHLVKDGGGRIVRLLREHGYVVTRIPNRYDKRIGYVYASARRSGG